MTVAHLLPSLVVVLGVAVAAVGCGPGPGPAAEAVALTGEALVVRPLEPAVRERREAELHVARVHRDRHPDDVEAWIWLGRRTAYLGNYREAVDVYTEALDRFPDDPRLLRHRGHRWLTLRRLAEAERDLERGLELASHRPDEMEQDGLPNARGIPTSTLKSNLWYHLALARFVGGRFDEARPAWQAGLAAADNPDHRVATSHWLWSTLRRLGDAAAAERVLEPIGPGLEVIENHAYLKLLRLYRGEIAADALMAEVRESGGVELATVGFGVGHWHLVEGRPDRARAIFEEVVAAGEWPAFGHLAAEAELARLRDAR